MDYFVSLITHNEYILSAKLGKKEQITKIIHQKTHLYKKKSYFCTKERKEIL